MVERLSELERQRKENEESAYALIGAAFAKLLRDKTAPRREREAALKLAYWLYENRLDAGEALFFLDNTGFIVDPVFDPLYPKASDDPSTWGDDVPF